MSPGRWNSDGVKGVYCATTRAMAVLETAAHVDANRFPLNRFLVAIDVPQRVWDRRDVANAKTLDPQWSAVPAGMASADYGTRWLRRAPCALLELPSVIVQEETIVLLNPAHSDATHITAQIVRKFEYDLLFRR